MSHCPIVAHYPEPFDRVKRHHLASALTQARPKAGQWIIEPPTGEVWFYRDARELVARGWGHPHQMRPDRLWTYRLTDEGLRQRELLLAQIGVMA